MKDWQAADGMGLSIGVAVPERRLTSEVKKHLNTVGVLAASIGADGARRAVAVHVGTLHRFKGLECQG